MTARRLLAPLAALLMMLTGVTAAAPAQAGVTTFVTAMVGAQMRIIYNWTAPVPSGPLYVVFQSTTTGKYWVYQLSADTQTTSSGTILANPRSPVSPGCTSMCLTAKAGGTGTSSYLPTDLYVTQLVYRDSMGVTTRSATSSLMPNLFSATPAVSRPRGQQDVEPNSLTVDVDLPQSPMANSTVLKFAGTGSSRCTSSSASVRLTGAGRTNVRVTVQFDPFTATASTRQSYGTTTSPTPSPVYTAAASWDPTSGTTPTPSPSFTTPAWSPPTTTPSPIPLTTLNAATDGRLLRGCSYDVKTEWYTLTMLPGYPDAEYAAAYQSWAASPSPTQIGVCATPSAMFTTSPTPTCPRFQPPGHSVAQSLTIPDVPAAPTGLTTGYDNGAVPVFLTAPNDNYAAITGYEYTLDDGVTWTAFAAPAPGDPYVVPGLINGTAYSIKVRAVNGVGPGPASAAVTGTPMTSPSAPAGPSIVRGDGQADVVLSGPVNDGGSPVTNFEYTLDDGAHWTALAPARTSSPLTIAGLSNGTQYSVRVRAVNAVGPGAASQPLTVTPCGLPGVPAALAATPQPRSAAVVSSGAATGGCAISDYQYSVDGGGWTSSGQADGSFTIPDLTNGTTYAVRVRALNDVGPGPATAAVDVTPGEVPSAPTGLDYKAEDGAVSISFTAPDSGGRAISGYEYSLEESEWRAADSPGSPVRIAGLFSGTQYVVRLRARNEFGPGLPSAPITVTPQPSAVAQSPPAGVAKKEQKRADGTAGPPRRIQITGATVVTPSGARTNAGQPIRTRVTGGPSGAAAQGEVRYFSVLRGPHGKVVVRTFGRTDLRLVVLQTAPGTQQYAAFRDRAVYVGGRQR